MSAGCTIVASDTQPLHEAIKNNETGKLVDFFDAEALASEVYGLLERPDERKRLGKNARQFAVENFDLRKVCLPKQLFDHFIIFLVYRLIIFRYIFYNFKHINRRTHRYGRSGSTG
jgi:glycosyltransferase involved in cell wall biosynthesis